MSTPRRNESPAGYADPGPSPPPSLDLIRYLQELPALRDSDRVAGCPLYLLAEAITVVPYQRTRGGWTCVVFHSTTHSTGAELTVTDLAIRTALGVDLLDPVADLPTATFVAVWRARVLAVGGGQEVAVVARVLVEGLRQPQSRSIVLDARTVRQLAGHAGVTSQAVAECLGRLRRAGLLQGGDQVSGAYTLTLPESGPQRVRHGWATCLGLPSGGMCDTNL